MALAPPEPRDELEGFPKEGRFLSHLPSFFSYGIKCKDTDTPTVTSLMVCDLQGLGYVLGDIDPSLSEHDLSPSELQTYRKRRDESNYVLASLIPLTVRWNRLFSDKALDQFKEGATVDLSSPYSASRDILDRLEELRREIHKTKSTIQERCEVRAGGSKEE